MPGTKGHSGIYQHKKGYKRPLISELQKGRGNHFYGKKHSKETKERMRQKKIGHIPWNKGNHINLNPNGGFKKGHTPWNKGMAGWTSSGTFKKGKEHPDWKGGISFLPYSIDWTQTLKRSIRERDNYICQICSQYGNLVHHIDYNKLNCNPENLITLCKKCHTRTNHNREDWKSFFSNISSG